MLEKIIDWVGGLVIHMVKALLAPIYGFMDTIPVLVFGGDKSNLDFLYEKNAVTNVLDTGMPVMFKLVAFCVLVSVVITAAKYSATTLNPNNRTALIEYAKDLMIISICLWHLDFFYNFVFDLNSWITLEFKEAINGVNNGNFNPDQQIP